jgi:transposase
MKKSLNRMSYKGKTVCVGIDVHKKTYSVVAVVEGEVVKKWRTPANSVTLADQLRRYFLEAKIKTVYEAGFSGFVLHRDLEKAGIESIVVNPASIEVAVNNRVKTDKRDALKMATLLEAGRLKGIRIPTEEEEQGRLLTRTRQQLVEQRTSLKNQIRMKFHQMGLIDVEEERSLTHQLVAELLEKSKSPELQIVVCALQNVWKSIDLEIKKIELKLKEQAQQDENESTYRSAPGIGFLAARVLSNELGNMSHFDNERQLFSYTGLTPSEYSSGETTCKGHITRVGNSRVRHILNQAAWQAISKDLDLKKFFERLYPKTGKKKAIVAVARKLIGRLRAAFRKGVLYQLNPVTPKSVAVLATD